jgi:crossover junction endodeoxyribonuclease RuvC
MIIAAIDPGLTGAIAFLNAAGECVCHDMPVHRLTRNGKNKGEVDAHGLAALFWKEHAGHCFVETVGAMPGQGTTSMFSLGRSFGIIIGVLAAVGVPYTFVAPRKWKSALGVPAAKDGARARASQLLPEAAHQWPLVKHDGRAEAALISLYGRQSFGAIAAQPRREPADLFATGGAL